MIKKGRMRKKQDVLNCPRFFIAMIFQREVSEIHQAKAWH